MLITILFTKTLFLDLLMELQLFYVSEPNGLFELCRGSTTSVNYWLCGTYSVRRSFHLRTLFSLYYLNAFLFGIYRRAINKGIGVDNMHYLNDGLWKVNIF